jgi:fumarylacetoacetate (FAA) hydrolase
VTPEELGAAWDGGKLHLPLVTHLNGQPFGKPNAGVDMTFDFGQLIAHAARTRPLAAGTIIGSGTVSNKARTVAPASRSRKAAPAIPASPSNAPSRPC